MSDTPIKIDRSTLVPIGVVVTLVIILFTGFGWLDSRFSDVMQALDDQDRRLEKLEEQKENTWTSIEQRLWVSEFRRLNPEIKVPE